MNEVVRVWIGNPHNEGRFNGTAFFIDTHTLVTAKHVITNREGEVYDNIFLGNTPDGGIIPIDEVQLCQRDLAVLTVKKDFQIEVASFTKEIKEGEDVEIIGFYDANSSQKTYENRVSGYQSLEHTYELQNHLTNGLSGSPLFLNGKICGVAKAINIQKNITYLIPIDELCIQSEKFFKDKEAPKKKLTLEQWASIAGIVGTIIAILSLIIPSSSVPKPKPTESTHEVREKKQVYILKGTVQDQESHLLAEVDVWEGREGTMTQTDKSGQYFFKAIKGTNSETVEVKFSKRGYHDRTQQQTFGEKNDVQLQQKVD